MKRITAFAAMLFVCLLVNRLGATVSIVKNGSFEYDDNLILTLDSQTPKYWCDANIPTDDFTAYVNDNWSSHGPQGEAGHSLTFASIYDVTFEAGQTAYISQQVYPADVSILAFDVHLTSEYGSSWDWDPCAFSAVVMIDDEPIWDSNQLDFIGNGTYHVEINDINIADEGLHLLTLAMKANATTSEPYWIQYILRWDFVKFDTYCGGLGYLPHDFDRDCYVDIYDMQILAAEWLSSQSPQFDLFADYEDDIDFRDFAVFAAHWSDINCQGPDYCGGCDFDQSGAVDTNDLLAFAENWLNWSVLYSDLDGDGSVRFDDFATFAQSWMLSSAWQEYGTDNFSEPSLLLLESDLNDDGIVDYDDLYNLSVDWLTAGSCIRSDLDGSGFVDFYDFAVLADQWRMKGTLYDWN